MTSIEERLGALEDRVGISEAVATYALHIMRGEAVNIPDLFTADGRLVIESGQIDVAGREALEAFFGRMQPGTAFPFVRTSCIELDGDHAVHTGVMMSQAVGERSGYIGIYTDQMRRVSGRWLFTERRFVFSQGDPYAKVDVAK